MPDLDNPPGAGTEGSIADKTIAVVINKQAGTVAGSPSVDDPDSVARLFEKYSSKPKITFAEPTRLAKEVQEAVSSRAEVVIVGGGDGTINAAASYIHGTDKILGVLPLGTLNHFAESLEIPRLLEDAIPSLLAGSIGAVDVGEVNGRIFLNNASLGIYPEAVRRRERYTDQQGPRKFIAMGYALLALFWELPLYRLVIEAQGSRSSIRTPFVFLGNNRYDPKFPSYAKRESLTEGCLSIFYAHGITRLGLAKIGLNILLGRLTLIPDLERMEAVELTIRTRMKRVQVALDGEVLRMRSPLRFRILPKSLKVIFPRKEQ